MKMKNINLDKLVIFMVGILFGYGIKELTLGEWKVALVFITFAIVCYTLDKATSKDRRTSK